MGEIWLYSKFTVNLQQISKTLIISISFAIDDDEKRQQELNSLLKIDDSFLKIVIVGQDIVEYTDEKGIRFMGLFQFLQSDIR